MATTNEELVEEISQMMDLCEEGVHPTCDTRRNRLREIFAAKDAACEERVREIEKAYGGCHYCYGKGYGTQTAAWEGRGYYKKLPTMKFCSCERGEQLKSLLTPPLPDQESSK